MVAAKMYIANSIHFLFSLYTVMIFVYVISSWFPNIRHYTFMRFIAFYVEPYLQLFRRFIPPIGGVMDLSPLIAFFVLRFLEPIIINIIYRIF